MRILDLFKIQAFDVKKPFTSKTSSPDVEEHKNFIPPQLT
jgi:hypothetical protein